MGFCGFEQSVGRRQGRRLKGGTRRTIPPENQLQSQGAYPTMRFLTEAQSVQCMTAATLPGAGTGVMRSTLTGARA